LDSIGFPRAKKANAEFKGLMPEDAKEAFGLGIRAKRSQSVAVGFEDVEAEASHAPIERID
jgi:hypothetical protein